MTTDQRVLLGELLSIAKRDRARRTRRKAFDEFLGNLIAGQITLAVVALINGWMLMLAVAVTHEHWIPELPTIGYWWAVLITWLLRLGTGAGSSKGGAK